MNPASATKSLNQVVDMQTIAVSKVRHLQSGDEITFCEKRLENTGESI